MLGELHEEKTSAAKWVAPAGARIPIIDRAESHNSCVSDTFLRVPKFECGVSVLIRVHWTQRTGTKQPKRQHMQRLMRAKLSLGRTLMQEGNDWVAVNREIQGANNSTVSVSYLHSRNAIFRNCASSSAIYCNIRANIHAGAGSAEKPRAKQRHEKTRTEQVKTAEQSAEERRSAEGFNGTRKRQGAHRRRRCWTRRSRGSRSLLARPARGAHWVHVRREGEPSA